MDPKTEEQKQGVQHTRALVLTETHDLMQTILIQEKAKAERPHKLTLVDLYHEAALLLKKKRGL